jgi:hypothetical protein
VIKQLLDLQWWNLSSSEIEKIVPFLCFQRSNDLEKNLEAIYETLNLKK